MRRIMKRLVLISTLLTTLFIALALPVFTSCNTDNNTHIYNTLQTPSTLDQSKMNVSIESSADYIAAVRHIDITDKLRYGHILIGIFAGTYLLLKVICVKENN